MPRQEITLRNDIGELGRLTKFIDAFGEKEGLGEKDLFAITLSLDELVTNVISYAYVDGEPHEIRVSMEKAGQDVNILLEDEGRPFDPTHAAEPDVSLPVEERRVGGLGIHFVRKMMSNFSYERVDEKNRVHLRKRVG